MKAAASLLLVSVLLGFAAQRSPGTTSGATPTSTPVLVDGPTLPIVKDYLPSTTGTGPQILNFSSNPSSPTKGALVEWSFDLSKTYPNPYYFYDPTDTAASNPSTMSWYGVDGVSVDLLLTSPSGKSIDVPAFWDENYVRLQANGTEVLGKVDNGHWRVRFTPTEAGTYTYTVTAQDASGTSSFPSTGPLNLTVADAPSKGFVHPSVADSRFAAYDNGSSFVPISAPWGLQWWSNAQLKSYAYENDFATAGAAKVNLARVWESSDFALSTEGAQPVWTEQPGANTNVEIGTANVHSGLRAANVTVGNGWHQSLAVASPGQTYQLSVWVKTSNLAGGGAYANLTAGPDFNGGTVLGSIGPISGTTGYTQYTVTFSPGVSNNVVSLNLYATGTAGNAYFDDVAFGPSDGAGGIRYNAVSDPGMERQFAKGMTTSDPSANPSLPRPLGNYYNQWASYELDKIVESAQTNGIELQLCSCSGPWFTWPVDPGLGTYDATWNQPWVLHSWERNFRYRVARWGYSPAILAWEMQNETGAVPADSPEFSFFTKYGAYQQATDPYHHLRTTSEGSQAFSASLWTSGAMDLANYHDYAWPCCGASGQPRYPGLWNDDAAFVYEIAWCLRNLTLYCNGLADSSGVAWSGPPKPIVWGETGILYPDWGNAYPAGTSGEGGHRAIHNHLWAGLFSPIGTSPIEWNEPTDQATITASFAERLVAANFFGNVDYAHGGFTYLMTSADAPAGYSGETIGASDPGARVYAMRRQDRTAAYLWVQNRNHTWYNAPSVPSPINPVITIGGLLNQAYTVEVWNPYTGAILSSSQQTPSAGSISISLSGLTDDEAIKVR